MKKAYRRLALRYHPDKQSEEDAASASRMFQLVQRAYEVLCDLKRRQDYNELITFAWRVEMGGADE